MKQRGVKNYFVLISKGMAMGAADVVPGVSGGSIAFILGIYDELLSTLSRLSPLLLRTWIQQGFGAFFRETNMAFLLAVFGGILISVKLLAALIAFLLENYAIHLWAFFFGLVLASIPVFIRSRNDWSWVDLFAALVGACAVLVLAWMQPAELPDSNLVLFFGGFIAICAMILPGVSGSFILLILGLYPIVINAIDQLEWQAIASFGLGCVAGLLVFSRFLHWLLSRYERPTLAVLVGFLLGSLYVLWPWKLALSSQDDPVLATSINQEHAVWPWTYSEFLTTDAHVFAALLLSLVGIFLILLFDFISNSSKKNNIK